MYNGTECETSHLTPKTNGYCSAEVNGRMVRAHRLAWEKAKGPIPAGAQVRHMCGNKRCVNVDHLALGTQSDNELDKSEHVRSEAVRKANITRGNKKSGLPTYVKHANNGGYRVVKKGVHLFFSRSLAEATAFAASLGSATHPRPLPPSERLEDQAPSE